MGEELQIYNLFVRIIYFPRSSLLLSLELRYTYKVVVVSELRCLYLCCEWIGRFKLLLTNTTMKPKYENTVNTTSPTIKSSSSSNIAGVFNIGTLVNVILTGNKINTSRSWIWIWKGTCDWWDRPILSVWVWWYYRAIESDMLSPMKLQSFCYNSVLMYDSFHI